MTVSESKWTITVVQGGNEVEYANGIMLKADGENYVSQVNNSLGSDGTMKPYYSNETGTYSVSGGTLTLNTINNSAEFDMSGAWTKKTT